LPRKAPSQVIEHRLTLGDFERRETKQALEVILKRQNQQRYIEGGKAVIIGGSILTVGYLGFLGLGVIGAGLGAAEDLIQEVRDKAKEIIFGKTTYETENIPSNPDDWVGRDPDTGERINPLNYGATEGKFPVFSSLVGVGISWGETSWNWARDADAALRAAIGADPHDEP